MSDAEWTAQVRGNTLRLNAAMLKSAKDFEQRRRFDDQAVRRDNAQGQTQATRFSAAKSIQGVVIHEVGHLMLNRAREAGVDLSELCDALGVDRERASDASLPLKPESVPKAQRISEYAATDGDQYFAEAWVVYHTEGKKRVSPRVRKLIEKVKSLVNRK